MVKDIDFRGLSQVLPEKHTPLLLQIAWPAGGSRKARSGLPSDKLDFFFLLDFFHEFQDFKLNLQDKNNENAEPMNTK